MAHDSGLADIFREDLADIAGITERKMFGGVAFMLDGNMLCGVHPKGAMMRVGKDRAAAALAMPGTAPMDFGPRPMAGFIDVSDATMAEDTPRTALLALALDFVRALPAK